MVKKKIGLQNIEGNEVYIIDLSGLSGLHLITCCREMVENLNTLHGSYAFFVDVTSCRLNIESLSFLKSAGKNIQNRVLKSAIVGVNSNISPFFSSYLKYNSSKMMVFETKEQALSYLFSTDTETL